MATILIVDDSLFARVLLSDILTKGGHQVVGEASDGRQAVELYRQFKPELVILDITMPGLDGINSAKQILKLDPNAKIIICSALDQDPIVELSYSIGVKAYLTKPYNEQIILQTISEQIMENPR